MSEKPVILFESYPDFNGSTLEVYKELVRRGYEKKYDMVWAVYSNFNLNTNYKVIKFFNCNSPEKQSIIARTKCIIDSNRYIQKFSPGVFRLFLRHGLVLKKCRKYTHGIGQVDAIITTSNAMLELDEKLWAPCVKDKFILTGMPITDRLFSPKNVYDCGFIRELTGTNKRFNKIISWLPTYRDHRMRKCGKNIFQYGLPAIHDEIEYHALNEVLNKNNILLLIQMHHAQAKNYKSLDNCSNIFFITEPIKIKYELATSDILGNSDALLTDYSSAYHEYLILNKPIGLIIEDLVSYTKKSGFFCNYLDWIKGDYILDNKDLIAWITNISNGIDLSKSEREKSLNKVFKYKDNKATQRVVDFLIKNAKL